MLQLLSNTYLTCLLCYLVQYVSFLGLHRLTRNHLPMLLIHVATASHHYES